MALTEPGDHLTVTVNLAVPSGDMGVGGTLWCFDIDHLRRKLVLLLDGVRGGGRPIVSVEIMANLCKTK